MLKGNRAEPTGSLILVTGATRSGKSEWAEDLAIRSGRSVTYVATAFPNPQDPDWLARLEAHRQRRPHHWTTLECPPDLAATLLGASARDCLLIDSLGTWLAQHLEDTAEAWQQRHLSLLQSFQQTSALVIVVAEETGWGVVPAYASGRLFRDRLGDLIRWIGAIAQEVYLVTGGHALNLKQLGVPVQRSETLP
jgi:adenosylcobinamide kinase/adenosylcobinamide-phosphate guanylyltransferase